MKARNKHTGEICQVHWNMCDVGRECEASDMPPVCDEPTPCLIYNAVVDDYEFDVNYDGNWIDGLDYIKHPSKYERHNT